MKHVVSDTRHYDGIQFYIPAFLLSGSKGSFFILIILSKLTLRKSLRPQTVSAKRISGPCVTHANQTLISDK